MGEILSTREEVQDKVIVEVMLDKEEIMPLNGDTNDIVLFSRKHCSTKANLTQRGRNEATKYFLVPRTLRKQLQFNKEVSCQRFDSGDQAIFVYIADKFTG